MTTFLVEISLLKSARTTVKSKVKMKKFMLFHVTVSGLTNEPLCGSLLLRRLFVGVLDVHTTEAVLRLLSCLWSKCKDMDNISLKKRNGSTLSLIQTSFFS